MKRKYAVLMLAVLLSVFVSGLVPQAHADTTVVVAQYTGTTGVDAHQVIDIHPSDSIYKSAAGEIFNVSQTTRLVSMSFMLQSVGITDGLDGSWGAALYDVTNDSMTNAVPTTVVAYSWTLRGIDISGVAYAWYNFTFPSGPIMYANQHYAAVFYRLSGTDPAKFVDAKLGTVSDADMLLVQYVGSPAAEWQVSTTTETTFKVYGDTDLTGAGTPAPTNTPPVYIPVGDGTFYGAITWYVVAFIVILAPAGILYVMKLRSVGFMITGLVIGAGLGYIMMPSVVPLWFVFVVIIGLVGNFFRGQISGGTAGGESE